jgi:hypothetical protein
LQQQEDYSESGYENDFGEEDASEGQYDDRYPYSNEDDANSSWGLEEMA